MDNKGNDYWHELDELAKDGCYTSPSSESDCVYDIGEVIRECKRLGRPLTEEEKEKYRIKAKR